MKFPSWVSAPHHGRKAPPEVVAKRRLSYIVRRLALEHEPTGSLSDLGERVGILSSQFSLAFRSGRFTQRQAETIESALGRRVVKKEHLMYPLDIEESNKDEL
jgi:hypothetical protein